MAADALTCGQVIAYPTEAVWGLGCDPWDEDAVTRLLALKTRNVNKGLILISGDITHFNPLLADLSDTYRQKLANSWPGAYTWLVPHHGLVPAWVSGKFDTVAIRVSAHPYVRALTHAFGGAIISTSANPQGQPPARFSWQVAKYFRRFDEPFITQGQVGKQRKPSEVRDLITDQLIRAGGWFKTSSHPNGWL